MTDPFASASTVSPPGPIVAQAPAGGRPHRLLVPIIWEALLLVATIVAVAVVFLGDRRPTVGFFLVLLSPIGLLAVAVALSLRTATANLAVGALAFLAGTVGVSLTNNDMPLAAAMAIGVVVAAAVGLVLGILAAALSVPAWAVTLGGAAIIEAAILGATGGRTMVLSAASGQLSGLWFAVFVALTLGGGALWLIPGLRSTLSATRDVAPAGRWGGLRPGLGAVVGLTASGLLAGIAGVVYTLRLHAATPPNGSSLTLLGLAIALLGGVSVFGRRGGVAGVLLATILFGSIQHILLLNAVPSWVLTLVTGVVVLAGLAVSRLIETTSGIVERNG
jgi:ribose/xylose/arabinose/galactoside ABC-type transport system permease subunit